MSKRANGMMALAAGIVLAAAMMAAGQTGRPDKRPKPTDEAGKPAAEDKNPQPKNPPFNDVLKLYESLNHVGVGGQMPYRLLRPLGYSASRKYPMVVILHDVPGQGSDNLIHLSGTYAVGTLARSDIRAKYASFVLAPQSTTWWGDEPYVRKDGKTAPAGAKHFPAASLLLETVVEVMTTNSIDRDRVYVTGQAMGAFGVFNVIRQDPNMFAAAVTISGGGDPNSAWRFAHVPIWLFGGEQSKILHYSQEMYDALKKNHGKPNFTIIKGTKTNCWPQVYDALSTWDWLFTQRRVLKIPTTRSATQPATAPATGPTTRKAIRVDVE
jgi:predicted peptidase